MSWPQPGQIWLVQEAVDMRTGIDSLAARIQHSLGRTPADGAAYVFRNRRCNRIKALVFDATGIWLCQRRLHQGGFIWPEAGAQLFTLEPVQWEWLCKGVDWRRLSAKQIPDCLY